MDSPQLFRNFRFFVRGLEPQTMMQKMWFFGGDDAVISPKDG